MEARKSDNQPTTKISQSEHFTLKRKNRQIAKKVYYCYSCGNQSDAVRSGYINS